MHHRIFCAIVTITLAGCGTQAPERELELAPVSGTVQLDGMPVQGAIVSFIPLAETQNAEYATGVTDENGKYTLSVNGVGEGAVPGDYRVVISKFALPDGSPIPEGQAPADVGATESIPSRYSSVDNEALRFTIPQGGSSTAEFQLSTR